MTMRRTGFGIAMALLGLIVLGTEGPQSASAQVRRAGRAIARAASLDFGPLKASIADYSADVDAWEAADAAETAQEDVVADLEAQLAAAQVTLAELAAATEAAALTADDGLQTVNDNHQALRQ